jgi:hypothetical protein
MAKKKQQELRLVDGWSEGLWVSLPVKAVRIGWPVGIAEAARHLPPSRVRDTLIVQLFEDVFPAASELAAPIAECRDRKWEALCRRQTHHGRPGLTEAILAVNEQWARRQRSRDTEGMMARLYGEARKYGRWLQSRAFADFDSWLLIQPEDAGQVRYLDPTPFTGMPTAVADLYTHEGKALRAGVTLLSGTIEQHRELARRVRAEGGWHGVRAETHHEYLDREAAQRCQLEPRSPAERSTAHGPSHHEVPPPDAQRGPGPAPRR